ncbi:uncharacterized protein LOC122066986, partial [Macadamia integrifolia]|uniref:uncharacterized protein LOC122066986 n=1 Tax=Macadamia integrifolia TaxID=60698 RepID=UPI001C4FCB04
MALRVSPMLSKLIYEEQGAFQQGKIIFANIGLASELINIVHTSVRGGGMGLKLEVQKTYDTLSWEFLFSIMKTFGFSDRWIGWIHQILLTSKISVLLNGGPVGYLVWKRVFVK